MGRIGFTEVVDLCTGGMTIGEVFEERLGHLPDLNPMHFIVRVNQCNVFEHYRLQYGDCINVFSNKFYSE